VITSENIFLVKKLVGIDWFKMLIP